VSHPLEPGGSIRPLSAHPEPLLTLNASCKKCLRRAEKWTSVSPCPKGIVLITIALFLDSAAGNFEERRFFNIPTPVSHAVGPPPPTPPPSSAPPLVLIPARQNLLKTPGSWH